MGRNEALSLEDVGRRKDTPGIVFVHGLGGFAEKRLLGKRIEYFRGLKAAMEQWEIPAFFPVQPPFGSVADRASALATNLTQFPYEQIYLVAHSMGGLDCRYFITKLDVDRRVLGLATIATPHRGTPLAPWILDASGLAPKILRPWTKRALKDLTPDACQHFNELFPNRPDVRYISYAGMRPLSEMPPWFRPLTRLLDEQAGQNDSQVPVSSATWAEFKGIVRADHIELAGWNCTRANQRIQRPFDHLSFYQRVIADLLKA